MPAKSIQHFSVPYSALSFPGQVNPTGTIDFNASDLAHALFVTGRAPGDRLSHGDASVWEFLHRASIIPAYIRRGASGELLRSRLALELDRSEKVNLSYAIGQAMAGIFSQQILSTAFLMHIDRYCQRYDVRFSSTRKRADMFGYRADQGWIVVEAKGRSNFMEAALPNKLRQQKNSILSIDGQSPSLAVGSVASFPYGSMKVDAFDPPADETEPFAVDIDVDRYFLAYYEPFISALDFGQDRRVAREEGVLGAYRISSIFEQAGLRIGVLSSIDEEVRRAYQDGDWSGLADGVLGSLASRRAESPQAPEFPDGTYVETDWEDSITVNDWMY